MVQYSLRLIKLKTPFIILPSRCVAHITVEYIFKYHTTWLCIFKTYIHFNHSFLSKLISRGSYLLGYDAMLIFKWAPTFWRSLLLLPSGSQQSRIAKTMEAASASETSVTIYQLTVCHTPEDLNLHQHWCGNLKFHKLTFMFTIIHSDMISALFWDITLHNIPEERRLINIVVEA